MSEPTAGVSTTNGGGTAVLASLSDTDRAAWQKTGELPKSEPVTEPVEEMDDDEAEPVVAATPEKPAEKPAAAAAPTAEKPISKRQQAINDAIRGRVEAEQREKAIKAELDALKAKSGTALAAKPEPKPDAVPERALDPADPEPDIEKYDDFLKYQRDLMRWELRQDKRDAKAADEKAEAKKRDDEAAAYHEKRSKDWAARRDAEAAKNPVFAEKIIPFLANFYPGTPIGDTIMDSSVGPALAQHLFEHRDVLERIQSADPIVALRELGKLEAKYDVETTSASASAGPAAKTVTTAPVPPPTLSARSADLADPLDAALKDRDFRRYEAEANARDSKR